MFDVLLLFISWGCHAWLSVVLKVRLWNAVFIISSICILATRILSTVFSVFQGLITSRENIFFLRIFLHMHTTIICRKPANYMHYTMNNYYFAQWYYIWFKEGVTSTQWCFCNNGLSTWEYNRATMVQIIVF